MMGVNMCRFEVIMTIFDYANMQIYDLRRENGKWAVYIDHKAETFPQAIMIANHFIIYKLREVN